MTDIRREHRWRRGEVNLDAVIVVVGILIGVVLLITKPGSPDISPDFHPQTMPDQAPSIGEHLHISISATGDLEVSHWINARRPVSSLLLAPNASAPDRTTTFENIEVSAAGVTLATRPLLDEGTHYVPLSQPARRFKVTYRVEPPPRDNSSTIRGRELVFVPGLRVDYPRASDESVRRTITTPGEILNVACIRADTAPRPCGTTTTADGWRVDLAGADRDNGLLVQIQLSR